MHSRQLSGSFLSADVNPGDACLCSTREDRKSEKLPNCLPPALKHQMLSNLNTNLAAWEKWQKHEPDTQTVQRYLKYYFIDMKIRNPNKFTRNLETLSKIINRIQWFLQNNWTKVRYKEASMPLRLISFRYIQQSIFDPNYDSSMASLLTSA